MTREQFIETYDIQDGAVFLEPFELYSKGIIGHNLDRTRIIYSYQSLLDALALDYYKQANPGAEDFEKHASDYYLEAMEWLDYNTIRSLPYLGEQAPVIIYSAFVDVTTSHNQAQHIPGLVS